MSNPLKKIGKGIKKVFKAVGKVVKKVVKSKIFKIALIAAAVYFGGTALMAAYGSTAAAAGGTAAATAGSTAASTAGTTALSTGTMGSAATTVGAGSISPMAAAGGTIGSGAAATTAASAISPMAAMGTTTAASAGGSGILGSLTAGAKAVGSFAAKHPMITSQVINTGGQMLQGYAQGKIAEDERKYQEKLRGQQTIAGVRYDGKGNTAPIDTYQSLGALNSQLFSGVYSQRLTPLYQEQSLAQA